MESGFDYSKQECDATHLQDISIRRVLTRLALEEQGITPDPENLPTIPIFEGDHLVQIRGRRSEGYRFNPGVVPFHDGSLIRQCEMKGWWRPDSVEDWYQKNKVLLVNPDALHVFVAGVGENAVFLAASQAAYYEFRPGNANCLWFRKGKNIRDRVRAGELSGWCQIRGSRRKPFSQLHAFCQRFLQAPPVLHEKKLMFAELLERAGGISTLDAEAGFQ